MFYAMPYVPPSARTDASWEHFSGTKIILTKFLVTYKMQPIYDMYISVAFYGLIKI